ncbi:MAG: HAD-IIA family hydrolase [Micromonosporaceae bacterium]
MTPDVAERLRTVRGFVFDLDGTLVLGDRRNHGLKPLPGALAITNWLRERDVPFVVLTNGTTRTPAQYAQMLRQIGFAVADDAVVTPASSAAAVFARRRYARVMALGNEGLAAPLRDAGIEVIPPDGRNAAADAVLVGWYPEFTMEALESACHCVWDGALLYSCSESPFFATADGRALGTSRAISAMIKSLTGCRIQIVGKPSLHALRRARSGLGVPLKEVAVVGDDPGLEVPMAHRGGALAIAVHTGIGGAGSFAHLSADRAPHLTVHGVDELLSVCKRLGVGIP